MGAGGRRQARAGGSGLSPAARLVRRHDPDRFLTALFAPAARREALLLLYAFNHELARAGEIASQSTLALIRLQWWREAVEGAPRPHEVATPLARALAEGMLEPASLLSLIEAREIEAEPPIPTLAAWRDYLLGTAGQVAAIAGGLLGASDCEGLRLLGAAYGAAGVLRSVEIQASRGRCLLPEDVLARHGLSVEAVIAAPRAAALLPVMRVLAEGGRGMLRAGLGVTVPRRAIAAGLPAVLARRDLDRIVRGSSVRSSSRERGVADRLAVVRAALLGRI
ncbi:MAG: squalene/phytoene synthase family protein [Acidisphaera sp.]|nr:squalene/phytoene synthase family protein [Acidisphaera sp.]